MLAISLLVLAIFFISAISSGARLEGKVLADIEQGRFEATPGTLLLVGKLKAAGVVRDDDGRLLVDAAARDAHLARLKARVTRSAVIALSLAVVMAIATKLLLDGAGQ